MKHVLISTMLLAFTVACGTAQQKTLDQAQQTASGALTAQAAPANALPRTGWVVQYAPASANNPNVILDGNESTVWTSSGNQANTLRGLRIDLGAVRSFNKIVLEAGAGSQNVLRSYNVYLSNDVNKWEPFVRSGTWNGGSRLEIDLGTQSGRYLTIQNGYANPGRPWSVAELWLTGSTVVNPTPGISGFEIKRAININTADSPYLGVPLPADQMARVKRAGFDGFRLMTDVAMTAKENSQPYLDPDGTFNAYGKQKVDAAVNNALTNGLKVIVDIHSMRAFPGTNTKFNDAILCGGKLPAFEKFLQGLAQHLSKYPRSQVALELMNEPNTDGCGPGLVTNYPGLLKRMYDAARRGSGDMMLVISGLANSSPFTGELNVMNGFLASNPDKNIMVTVHYYGPLAFSHQGATYVGGQEYLNCFQNIPYPTKSLTAPQRQAVIDRTMTKVAATPFCGGAAAISRATAALNEHLNYNGGAGIDAGDIQYVAEQVRLWANARGLPASRIFLGEFGVQGSMQRDTLYNGALPTLGATQTDRATWTRDVRSSFAVQGFSWAYFAYSGGAYSILADRGFPTQNYVVWDSSITGALGLITP